jgi:hypothetical protein
MSDAPDEESFTPREIRAFLVDMFPGCESAQIGRAVAENSTLWLAMDFLLTAVFLRDSAASFEAGSSAPWQTVIKRRSPDLGYENAEYPRSNTVDGYAVSEHYKPSKRARTKAQKKLGKDIYSNHVELVSATPKNNAWGRIDADVTYLEKRLVLPRTKIASKYHSSGASIPNTLVALLEEDLTEFLNEEPKELLENIAVQLSGEHPKLYYSDVLRLCQLLRDPLADAHTIVVYLDQAEEPDQSPEIIHTPVRAAATPSLDPYTTLHSVNPKKGAELEQEYAGMIDKAAIEAEKAKLYWRRGKSDKLLLQAASVFSDERRAATDRAVKINSQLADIRAEEQSGKDYVDLHGINVADAKRIVQAKLQTYWKDLRENSERSRGPLRGYYRIITGRGLHSDKRAVLGPAISKMLVRDGWKICVMTGELAVVGRQRSVE